MPISLHRASRAQIDPRGRRPLSSFLPAYLQEKAGQVASKTLEEIGTKIS